MRLSVLWKVAVLVAVLVILYEVTGGRA